MRKIFLVFSIFILTCFIISCKTDMKIMNYNLTNITEQNIETISIQRLCSEDHSNADCICTSNFSKKSTQFGFFCVSSKCEHYIFMDTCVRDCPEGYTRFKFNDLVDYQQYYICYPIKNHTLICDDFPAYDNCVCPEGKKVVNTPAGTACLDNSYCEDYILDDNKSICVKECPDGYVVSGCTGCPQSACVNVKQISKDNVHFYAWDILRNSNLSFYSQRLCSSINLNEHDTKFEIIIKCRDTEDCSMYIYPNRTYEFSNCTD